MYWTLWHATLTMISMPPIPLGVDLGGTKLLILAETPAGERTWKFPTGPGFTPVDFDAHHTTLRAKHTAAEHIYIQDIPRLVKK